MGHTTCQHDVVSSFGKTIVGFITIALERAAKVYRNNLFKTVGCSAGLPMKDHIPTWCTTGPEVAELGLSVAWGKVADRGLIYLDITTSKYLFIDFIVDRLKPVGRQANPFG